MSLLDKLKSLLGGSQSAPSDAAAPSDPPAMAESTIGETHDNDHEGHDHEGHSHSHEPLGDSPAEPRQD